MIALIIVPQTGGYATSGSGTMKFSSKASDSKKNPPLISSSLTPITQNYAVTNVIQTTTLYDNFDSGSYVLYDGQTSPNGKWYDSYNGYGLSGVTRDVATGNLVYFEYPQTSTSSTQTHSDLTLSTYWFDNYKLSLDMKTVKQLRQNSPPNNWENAWVMFDYVDNYHHYYFTLKDNGCELGKKDNNLHQDAQIFLATCSTPSVAHGYWQHVDIVMNGNKIQVYVDGSIVVFDGGLTTITDATQSSAFAAGGKIGLYNEDSSVEFNNVYITPIQ